MSRLQFSEPEVTDSLEGSVIPPDVWNYLFTSRYIPDLSAESSSTCSSGCFESEYNWCTSEYPCLSSDEGSEIPKCYTIDGESWVYGIRMTPSAKEAREQRKRKQYRQDLEELQDIERANAQITQEEERSELMSYYQDALSSLKPTKAKRKKKRKPKTKTSDWLASAIDILEDSNLS